MATNRRRRNIQSGREPGRSSSRANTGRSSQAALNKNNQARRGTNSHRRGRRRKKHPMLKMFRVLLLIIVLFFGVRFVLNLVGDRDVKEAGTTVKVGMFGGITEYINDDFSQKNYDLEEFQTELEGQIKDYCDLAGNDEAVVLKKIKSGENNISVVIKYSADSDYRNFNGMDLYSGKAEEFLSKPVEYKELLQPVNEEETAASLKELSKLGGYKVLYAQEVQNLYVPGKIKFYSDNCELVSNHSVKVAGEEPACIVYK